MTWWNPLTWFAKTQGVFVEVFLDYGFGRIEACGNPDSWPAWRPVLHIPDLDLKSAQKKLAGRRFNWHLLPMPIRAQLQLGRQVHREPWSEVEQFLAEELG